MKTMEMVLVEERNQLEKIMEIVRKRIKQHPRDIYALENGMGL